MSRLLSQMGHATRRAGAGLLALCSAVACAACNPFATVGPPPKIGQDCGTITRGATADLIGPTTCLLKDYKSCRTATLVYIQNDTDTSDTHTIYVKPQGSGCAVSDSDLYLSIRRDLTRRDYQCTGITQPQGPLVFTSTGFQRWPGEVIVTGCGQEGDLHLPAPPPPRTPQRTGRDCGSVTVLQGHVQGNPAGPETCFSHAYTSCQAATLDYTGDVATGPNVVNVLTILPQNQGCMLYDQWTDASFSQLLDVFTCTGLVPRSNGLAVPTCTDAAGVEVGLFIPAR